MNNIFLILEVLFWFSIAAIFHSYLFFPIVLKVLSIGKHPNNDIYNKDNIEQLPTVSILIAAYNEESVIAEKIKSIYNTSYPIDKIELLIGSDNSSDSTNSIIEEYQNIYKSLNFTCFNERNGKIKIINQLALKAKGDILILTDANVFFTPDTIYHLVKHYKNPKIQLVGGLIENTNLKNDGISKQEKSYLSNENMIKYREGLIWGSMIGTFGGVFSTIRKSFSQVPENFISDDFYITMKIIQNGGKTILEPQALCFEDVSNKISEEFRRKIRISMGNFQNLLEFRSIAFRLFSGAAFCFFSHKILRWLTPFFIIINLLSSAFLFCTSDLYAILFLGHIFILLLPILDFILKKVQIHIVLLRFITHFYSMNLALLIGFFRFIKGIDTNIWQPTKRNQ